MELCKGSTILYYSQIALVTMEYCYPRESTTFPCSYVCIISLCALSGRFIVVWAGKAVRYKSGTVPCTVPSQLRALPVIGQCLYKGLIKVVLRSCGVKIIER